MDVGDDLTRISAVELAARIARSEVSSLEVVDAHIQRIETVNTRLNAVVFKDYANARRDAIAADARRSCGEAMPPLHGVPITVKECIDVTATPSTFGLTSRANILATSDALAVARLRKAGAIVLGKTNVAQLLLYYESDNPVYGRTNNPWNAMRTAGGSSGGEGAIIAAGGSPLGLGTDIGGSVRIPAAFCGIASLKPTAGRVDDPGRFSVPIGQRAIVSQIGPLARHVEDVAAALEVVAGPNGTATPPLGDYRHVDLSRLRIGYYTDDETLGVAPAVARAVTEAAEVLRSQGAQVTQWRPPDVPKAVALYFGLLSADGATGFKRMWAGGKRDSRASAMALLAGLPAPVRAMAVATLKAMGQPSLSAFVGLFGHTSADAYWSLVEQQLVYQARFAEALDLEGIDVIVCPPCALPAYTHGASGVVGTGGGYSILYNLLGYPAGVVPFTRVRASEETTRPRARDLVEKAARDVENGSTGLPVGVQVVGRPWMEHEPLAVMASLQSGARARRDYPTTPPDNTSTPTPEKS